MEFCQRRKRYLFIQSVCQISQHKCYFSRKWILSTYNTKKIWQHLTIRISENISQGWESWMRQFGFVESFWSVYRVPGQIVWCRSDNISQECSARSQNTLCGEPGQTFYHMYLQNIDWSQYWIICSTCNWLKCTIRKPNEPWKFTPTHIMKVYINSYNPLHVITKWYQCSRLSLVEFFCVHIGLIGIFPNPKLSEPAIYVFELLKWKAGSPPDFKKSLGVGWRAWLCPGREAGARKTSNGNTMEQ